MTQRLQARKDINYPSNYTGAPGELVYNSNNKSINVHDGETEGGFELAQSEDVYTKSSVDDSLSLKADKSTTYTKTDVDDLLDDKANTTDITSRISNCVLSTPYMVDITLSDGVLTLLAGSRLIYPAGTSAPGKSVGDAYEVGVIDEVCWDGNKLFYIVKTNQNIVQTIPWGTSEQVVAIIGENNFRVVGRNRLYYTNSIPTTTVATSYWYYHYDENVIYYGSASVIPRKINMCFPIALCVNDGSTQTVTSMNTIFQHIGIFGQGAWVMKGVKALVPNYRDSNGCLKSTPVTLSHVQTCSVNSGSEGIVINNLGNISSASLSYWIYRPKENMNIASDSKISLFTKLANIRVDSNGRIERLIDIEPHSFCGYKDAANASYPNGNNYIDLTLGASGTSYSASTIR